MLKKFTESLVFGGGFAISFIVLWYVAAYLITPMFVGSQIEKVNKQFSDIDTKTHSSSLTRSESFRESGIPFHELKLDEQIKNSSVIAIAKYEPAPDGKMKAIIKEFLKKEPSVTLYYNVGDECFAIGDKRDVHVLAFLKGLVRGYGVVSVNYRLSGEAVFPAGLQDIKAAIRWLRANSRQYRHDGNRIAACGGSSGGNYAAMVCLTAHVTEFDDLSLGNPEYPCTVQAAVDWFGPTDFLKMDDQLEENGFGPSDHGEATSPESRYLGAKLSEVPLKVEIANPMTYIHEQMPPLLIQHGRLDTMVPVQQSMMFVEKLEKYVPHDRFEFDIIEGAGHGDPLFETDENMDRVFSFIDKHLRN